MKTSCAHCHCLDLRFVKFTTIFDVVCCFVGCISIAGDLNPSVYSSHQFGIPARVYLPSSANPLRPRLSRNIPDVDLPPDLSPDVPYLTAKTCVCPYTPRSPDQKNLTFCCSELSWSLTQACRQRGGVERDNLVLHRPPTPTAKAILCRHMCKAAA